MKSGIYKIQNKKTHQYYIGQSVNIENRLQQHKRELKDGNHINGKLQEDYKKYGEENFIFEPVHMCDEEFLNVMEKYYIEKYDCLKNGYNLQDISSFVRPQIREELLADKTKREFKKLKEITINIPEERYYLCKFYAHINYLNDLYCDEIIKRDNNTEAEDWFYWSAFISVDNKLFIENNNKVIDSVLSELNNKFSRVCDFYILDFEFEDNNLMCELNLTDKHDESKIVYNRIIVKIKSDI